MKKTDKILLGIVAGILLLVIVAFVVALSKPKPTYQAEDTPEGVAFNYLFALQQKDYERAYSYLSPSIRGYPKNANAFSEDVRDRSYHFRDLHDSSYSLDVGSVYIAGMRADVSIQETHFYEGDLFYSGQYTSTFTMNLRQDKNGDWKIEASDDYWLWCWNHEKGC